MATSKLAEMITELRMRHVGGFAHDSFEADLWLTVRAFANGTEIRNGVPVSREELGQLRRLAEEERGFFDYDALLAKHVFYDFGDLMQASRRWRVAGRYGQERVPGQKRLDASSVPAIVTPASIPQHPGHPGYLAA